MPAKHRTDVSWGSAELKEWLERYTARKGTTISELCQGFVKRLRTREERRVEGFGRPRAK